MPSPGRDPLANLRASVRAIAEDMVRRGEVKSAYQVFAGVERARSIPDDRRAERLRLTEAWHQRAQARASGALSEDELSDEDETVSAASDALLAAPQLRRIRRAL